MISTMINEKGIYEALDMNHHVHPVQNPAAPARMSVYLPIIIHKDKLRPYDEIGRGGRNQNNPAKTETMEYRNTLCLEERYKILHRNAEKRRIQEMLLGFITERGGRILNKVPHDDMHYYVVSNSVALIKMATKLRDGPDPTMIDDASIHSFPTDDMDLEDGFKVTEIVF